MILFAHIIGGVAVSPDENCIKDILLLARQAIDKGKVDFVPRDKNMKTLTRLGIMPQDVYDIIKSLKTTNYYSGPEKDRNQDRSGDIWVFKKNFNSEYLYIKFKINFSAEGMLKILSFHIDFCD